MKGGIFIFFNRKKVLLLITSFFCLLCLVNTNKQIKTKNLSSNEITHSAEKEENTETSTKSINKESDDSKYINTIISIPNELIFEIITNYIQSSIGEKTINELTLTSSKNTIHSSLSIDILKSNLLLNFDIKIHDLTDNKLSIYISNITIGNIKVSNKIVKPLLSHISKENILISNTGSNIEVQVNLNDFIDENIIISKIKLDDLKTTLNIDIKI